MSTSSADDTVTGRPWYREPWMWLVTGLPAAAVIAAFVTLGLAIHGSDELVRDDFRNEGLSIHPDPRRDAAAATYGARASVAIDAATGAVTLVPVVTRGPPPAGLLLILSHATRSTLDRMVHLQRGETAWTGSAGALPDGHWYVEVTPTDRAWRLTGDFRGAGARLELEPQGGP